jgi:hypothetical protein
VSGKKATGEAFSEDTSTLIVNAHGGLIAMKEPVAGGQIVKLRNMTSEDAIDCTVVDVEVGEDGSPEIGIEFVEPNAKFWHISFPPSDWSPRSPEAKRFSMPISSGNVDPSKK